MADSLQLIAVKRAIKSLDIDSLMKLMLFTTEEYDLVGNILKKALIQVKNKFNRIKHSEWALTSTSCESELSKDQRCYIDEFVILVYSKTESMSLVVRTYYHQNFIADTANGKFWIEFKKNKVKNVYLKIEYDLFVEILSGKKFSGKITNEEIIQTIKKSDSFKSKHCSIYYD